MLDILAIHTWRSKSSYLINPRGGYKKLNFVFGNDTEVYRSCSLQWHNHFYVFGGIHYGKKRQVSMVNGYRLERKATLGFDFSTGACTVLNQISTKSIVLCFPFTVSERDVCRQSNNPLGSFTKLPNSNYNHQLTRIASFDGKNTIY